MAGGNGGSGGGTGGSPNGQNGGTGGGGWNGNGAGAVTIAEAGSATVGHSRLNACALRASRSRIGVARHSPFGRVRTEGPRAHKSAQIHPLDQNLTFS